MHYSPSIFLNPISRILLVVLALVLWAMMLNSAAAPLSASLTSLTVTVVNTENQPVPGIEVLLWQRIAGQWQFTGAYSLTDETGTHVFALSAPGEYTLEYNDPTGFYLREFHFDKRGITLADAIVVEGAAPIFVAATLDRAGVISGTIRSAKAPHLPVSSATVAIWQELEEGWQHFTQVSTNNYGLYSASGLPSGVYRVQAFATGYFDKYFPASANLSDAQSVAITAGIPVTDVDIQLEPTSRINGTLAPPATLSAEGYVVCAVGEEAALDPITFAPEECILTATTDTQGNFALNPMRAGRYALYFDDSAFPPRTRAGWYAGSGSLSPAIASSHVISLEVGTVFTTSVVILEAGLSIFGEVDDIQGAPATDAHARIYKQSGGLWHWYGIGEVNAQGRFVVRLPVDGIYTAGVFDANGAPVYHPGLTTFADASYTRIPTDTVAMDVALQLPEAGTLAGSVVDDTQAPLGGVEVHAFLWQGAGGPEDNHRAPEWLRSTITDENGNYILPGVGDEAIWLVARDHAMGNADTWYPEMLQFTQAVSITATSGVTHTLSQISMQPLAIAPPTSTVVSGVITNIATGEPVAGTLVTLHWRPGWRARMNARDWEPHTCPSHASTGEAIPFGDAAGDESGLGAFAGIGAFEPDTSILRTDGNGRFGWQLSPGCWYVEVQTHDGERVRSPLWGVVDALDSAPEWRMAIEAPTPTPTSTATPSATPSKTPSITPSITPSMTPSMTPSATPSVTPSVTQGSTPSSTPGSTPMATHTPSHTPTLVPSATPAATQTAPTIAAPTATAAVTPTPSITPMAGTVSATPTLAPDATIPAATATAQTTITPGPIPTATGTPARVFVYGVLFADSNGNGMQEPSEGGIAGAILELVGQVEEYNNGNVAAAGASQPWRQTTVTSAVGAYAFEDVPEGAYTLAVTPPKGVVLRGVYPLRLRIDAQVALTSLPIGVNAVPEGVHLPLILR